MLNGTPTVASVDIEGTVVIAEFFEQKGIQNPEDAATIAEIRRKGTDGEIDFTEGLRQRLELTGKNITPQMVQRVRGEFLRQFQSPEARELMRAIAGRVDRIAFITRGFLDVIGDPLSQSLKDAGVDKPCTIDGFCFNDLAARFGPDILPELSLNPEKGDKDNPLFYPGKSSVLYKRITRDMQNPRELKIVALGDGTSDIKAAEEAVKRLEAEGRRIKIFRILQKAGASRNGFEACTHSRAETIACLNGMAI